MKKAHFFITILVLSLLLTACAGQATQDATVNTAVTTTETATTESTATESSTTETATTESTATESSTTETATTESTATESSTTETATTESTATESSTTETATTETATTESTATESNTTETVTTETAATEEAALSVMSLDEIANKLSEGIADMPMAENIKIPADLYPSYLFIDYVNDSEALANESMISSAAHSAVLLRLPEGSDIEKIRSDIEQQADPAKWICVSAEKVEVVSNGNLILLVMSYQDVADTMVERFKSMK